jgi:hypothetical protein
MRNNRMVAGFPTVFLAAAAILALALRQGPPASSAQATPTPYHAGQPSPVASPHAMTPTVYPLPLPQDPASADTMTAAGAAMIQAAAGMAEAATTMTATDVPALVELGGHWAQDAVALRERGAWMVLAATADSMVHDPGKARELNLQNLRGNGLSMAAEGQAMAEHGREMLAEVEQLRRDGMLDEEMAGELSAGAQALVDAGEALAREGERMREYAENLLRSIGQ